MDQEQHNQILRAGCAKYGMTEREYRETIEYAVLCWNLCREKV